MYGGNAFVLFPTGLLLSQSKSRIFFSHSKKATQILYSGCFLYWI